MATMYITVDYFAADEPLRWKENGIFMGVILYIGAFPLRLINVQDLWP